MHNFLSSVRFMGLWVVGGVFALFGTLLATIILLLGASFVGAILFKNRAMGAPEVIISAGILYSLIGMSFGFIVGNIQQSLLRQKTGEHWRGWTVASMIGGAIGVDILALLVLRQAEFFIQTRTLPPPETAWILGLQILIIPLACLSFVQMLILGTYVRGAWTWVLANVVGAVAFLALLVADFMAAAATFGIGFVLLLAVSTVPGIVTGFAMLWLLHFNRRYSENW